MKSHWLKICLVLLLGSWYGCTPVSEEAKAQPSEERLFPIPRIPSVMTNPDDRITYLLLHYWENIDFNHHTLGDEDEMLERGFVDFLFAFSYVESAVLPEAVKNLIADAVVTTRRVAPLMSLAYKYLYHPHSPMLNEEYYRFFVEELLKLDWLCESDRIRLKYELATLNINRRGTRAANFSYVNENGQQKSLYGIASNHTLLLFYDPECDECQTLLAAMRSSPILSQQIAEKKVRLLTVCVESQSTVRPDKYVEMPETWVKGFLDNEAAIDETYILRALPTLFLLDKDKKVLLKETSLKAVEEYFISGE